MTPMDDPRKVLSEAGVEVPEVEHLYAADTHPDDQYPGSDLTVAGEVILALARLVAKYKANIDNVSALLKTMRETTVPEDVYEGARKLAHDWQLVAADQRELAEKYKWQRDHLMRESLEEHGFDPDDDTEGIFESEMEDLDRRWAEHEADHE